METRTRGMRKAKKNSFVQSTEKTKEKALRKTTKPAKDRVPLQDMPKNGNTNEIKTTRCSVVLKQLSPNSLQSPMRRFSEAENIYDFEESPSQEEIVAPNDELKEIYKDLEKKNIVKVAKRKPKIGKSKIGTATVKVKAASAKRKATTKPAVVSKKRKTHNLSAAADDKVHEIGGNETVTDNNNDDDAYSVHSVCSEIIDQNGEMIGLIEKEWSQLGSRTIRSRKHEAGDITKTSNTKISSNKVQIVDSIEPFETVETVTAPVDQSLQIVIPDELRKPDAADASQPQSKRSLRIAARNKSVATPVDETLPDDVMYTIPDDVADDVFAETPPTSSPLPTKRPIRLAARKKPEQSTPKPSRGKLNETDFFKNASPLTENDAVKVVAVKPHAPSSTDDENSKVNSIEIASDDELNAENGAKGIEQNQSYGNKSMMRVYGRSPLKNISNSFVMNTPTKTSSSVLFGQHMDSSRLRVSIDSGGSMLTIAQPKSAVRHIAETEPPSLSNCYGFDDDVDVVETTIECEELPKSVGDKSILAEKRKEYRRFLRNAEPMASTKGSPKKRTTPAKAMRVADIFPEASNAQRDIRWALQSNKNHETDDHGLNLFSDTETERTQDRRKSYTRAPKQYNRSWVTDSEHEDDQDEPAKESKKAKKPKGKPRKKLVGPKEKSAEEEELEKFAKEFNSHCEEVEQFEVPVIPE